MLFKLVLIVYFIVVTAVSGLCTLFLENLDSVTMIICLLTYGAMFYLEVKLLKKNWKLYRTGEYKEIKARKREQREMAKIKKTNEKKNGTSKVVKRTAIAGGVVAYTGLRVIANLAKKYK